MTEQHLEQTDDAATTTDPAGEDDTADAAHEPAGPAREAARYRRQLRDSEARAEALTARVEAMQRSEVERLAADQLDRPADLWLVRDDVADLLDDDDGGVDADKVADAVAAVLADRPGWRKSRAPSFDGGPRSQVPQAAGMQEVLRGRKGV